MTHNFSVGIDADTLSILNPIPAVRAETDTGPTHL
jgi:hypothetical protein